MYKKHNPELRQKYFSDYWKNSHKNRYLRSSKLFQKTTNTLFHLILYTILKLLLTTQVNKSQVIKGYYLKAKIVTHESHRS